MRFSEDEPAAVVLARLKANKPKQVTPHNRPGVPQALPDPTFGERMAAWEAAVAREEARAKEERTKKG